MARPLFIITDKNGNEVGRTTNAVEASAFYNARPDTELRQETTESDADTNTLPRLTQ